jgi:hypothetical protein
VATVQAPASADRAEYGLEDFVEPGLHLGFFGVHGRAASVVDCQPHRPLIRGGPSMPISLPRGRRESIEFLERAARITAARAPGWQGVHCQIRAASSTKATAAVWWPRTPPAGLSLRWGRWTPSRHTPAHWPLGRAVGQRRSWASSAIRCCWRQCQYTVDSWAVSYRTGF